MPCRAEHTHTRYRRVTTSAGAASARQPCNTPPHNQTHVRSLERAMTPGTLSQPCLYDMQEQQTPLPAYKRSIQAVHDRKTTRTTSNHVPTAARVAPSVPPSPVTSSCPAKAGGPCSSATGSRPVSAVSTRHAPCAAHLSKKLVTTLADKHHRPALPMPTTHRRSAGMASHSAQTCSTTGQRDNLAAAPVPPQTTRQHQQPEHLVTPS